METKCEYKKKKTTGERNMTIYKSIKKYKKMIILKID